MSLFHPKKGGMASAQRVESLSGRWADLALWTDADEDMSDHMVSAAGGTSMYREKERGREEDCRGEG